MTKQTTTYNNSGNRFLPSFIARLGKGFLLFLLMMVMGVGSAWAQSSGNGTETDPYIIANSTDLNTFGSAMNNNTAYWKLGADIDLGGAEWAHSGNGQKTFKGHFDGDGHTISNYKITPVANKANALFAIVQGTSATNRAEIKNLIIDNVTISATANLAATTYIGALAGNVSQYADIVDVNVSDVAISVANLTGANYHGGLAGRLQKNSTVNNCSVTGVSVTLGGNITGACYIGGAVGSLESSAGDDSSIKGCAVSGTIKTDGSSTLNNNLTNVFGGVVGYVAQSTTLFSEVRQCTSEVDFNLSGLTPATVSGSNYNMYRSGFVVGGVIGRINTPSQLPEHLYYSGKVYAPFAAVGPIVGVFNTNLNAAAYVYDDYSGLNATALSATEWKKADTWYFSDYKIGLSSDVTTQTTKTRNYNGTPAEEAGVNYLAVGEGTFKVENAISGASKLSATVLAYTADNNTGKTGISPQWSKNESTYPAYYMYFMQGVNRGLYKPTDTKEMMRLFASKGAYPKVEVDGDDTSGYEFAVDLGELATDANYTVRCQWYNSDKSSTIGTGSSLNVTKAEFESAGGVVNCEITVSGDDFSTASITLQGTDKVVVFVNGKSGKDNAPGSRTRGWTPGTPVKTIDHANSLLDGGPWDKNFIVVMGELASGTSEANCFKSRGTNPATITGKWNDTDYGGIINLVKTSSENSANPGEGPGKTGFHNYVSADTKFENLVFRAAGTPDNLFLDFHGHDVWLGKGLRMQGFQTLSENHGNLDYPTNQTPEFSILLTSTNLKEADIKKYTNRTKPQVVTIESGHYGRILGGRFTGAYFPSSDAYAILGSAEHPIWAVVNIDIDEKNEVNSADGGTTYSCDINCIVAGLTDGTMYGDYVINMHGGKVCYIVGGNQGNPVKNRDATFTQVGGKKRGNWGIWPNSSYFGRTVINVEPRDGCKPIVVDNIYAGGLGRKAQDSNAGTVVDMFMYGHTEVNMMDGNVTGNIYGGGAGGVIGVNPWDAHAPYETTAGDNAKSGIMNKVQYGDNRLGTDAWSSMTPESQMAKVKLHNLNDAGNDYDVEYLDLRNSTTELNIKGGTIGGNIYGGGCGMVSNMDKEVTMQGVGSIFGTATINVSGGTIGGSIYGGSEGDKKYYNATNKYGQTINHIAEMNGTVNLTITGTEEKYPRISGDIYGAGKGIATVGTEEYLRIATAGNTDLGEEYKTDINITIDMPESIEFPNDIYGGGALGKVDGNTNIILKQGTFTGNIYGGGYGEKAHLDKAMVTGTTNIYTGAADSTAVNRSLHVSIQPSVTGASKTPTIYGGGNMAQIKGNTFINLYHGKIKADVFGGGKGLSQAESGTFIGYGKVTGNTRVLYNNVTKDNLLTGTIFGGGALGAVEGNTTVVIKAGDVNGDVFGGGKGEEGSEKAKVTGNTNVIVDSEWKEPASATP